MGEYSPASCLIKEKGEDVQKEGGKERGKSRVSRNQIVILDSFDCYRKILIRFFRYIPKHFYKRYPKQAILELSSFLLKGAGGGGISQKIYFVSVTTKIGFSRFFFHCGCFVFKCMYNYTIQYALIHLLFCVAVSLNVYWIVSAPFLFAQLKRKLAYFRYCISVVYCNTFKVSGHTE
jgi:hypothetical protein